MGSEMTTVQSWTGVETKALRRAMRLSVRAFAAYLGVEARTVNRWEARGSDITLRPDTQAMLDSALRLIDEEVRARFRAGVEPEANWDKEVDTNRRDATKLIGLALAAAAQPALDAAEQFGLGPSRQRQRVDRGLVSGHQELAQAFAGLYRSADPRSVLPAAMAYADDVLTLLGAPMAEEYRTELGGIVAGMQAQIGLWACHLHRPAVAYRYLATACQIAGGTPDVALQARTLGAFSYYFSSAPRGGHGGDAQQAIALLTQALALASRADGFTVGWLATWRADQHGTLGDLDAARRDIDLAEQRLGADEDGTATGFFARPVYGYGMEEHCDSVRAVTLGLAGRTDEADRTFAAVHSAAANMRRRIATYGHQALVHVRTDEPETACAVLSQTVSLAVDHYYVMGLERAFGVRAGFDPAWTDLPCVRALDEQLRSLN